MLKITVILCTYNRYKSLAKALESVANSIVPASMGWDVLVVDNNSSDQTRDVVSDFCKRYPDRFYYLFEPRKGKSYALNSAVQEARGDVLAFVDDDVTVEPTWLHNLAATLNGGEWAGVGGRILPQWPCTPPSWFPEKEWFGMAPLAMFDLGLQAGPLTDAPFGTNMAFHRRMFQKYGLFRTDLGPGCSGEIRNEDTEFGQRLLGAGERLKYEPAALVYHSVPPNRLKKDYFLTWWFEKGRAEIRQAGAAPPKWWLLSRTPLYHIRKLAMGTLRWMVALKPAKRFTYKLTVWLLAGMIVESYRQSRTLKGPLQVDSIGPIRHNSDTSGRN